MMSLLRDPLIMILCLWSSCSMLHAADPLQGVVNRYGRVVAYDSCLGKLVVAPAPTLDPGDRILVHQGKGAQIDTTDAEGFGTVTTIGRAGTFEFLTVHHAIGNDVYVTTELRRSYDMVMGVQCITVAHHQQARIVDTVRGAAWDGAVGGVIVIECDDTLYVEAPIDASGIGFRGGRASVNRADTNVAGWVLPDDAGSAGRKGESCVMLPAHQGAGRGPNASGGGGGNARNGGGGGGANVSAGGRGGDQTTEFGPFDVGGRGGNGIVPISTDVRAMLGGGGGGGHQNDMLGTDGGHGGGVVIIRARSIVTTANASIDVSAAHALTADQDGAGGGGGGGSVILDVNNAPQPIDVQALGGNGGDARGTTRCYAPGGGGAGGLIMLTASSAITQASIREQILGGRAGRYYGTASECPNESSFGATPGSFGAVTRVGDIDRPGSAIVQHMIAPRDTTVCEGTILDLRISGAMSAQWLDTLHVIEPAALITSTSRLDTSIVIPVDVMTLRGCVVRDTVRITVRPAPRPRLVYATTLLTPSTPVITIGTDAPYTTYLWTQGEVQPSIDVTKPGRYWVTVRDSNGCVGTSDTVDVRSNMRGAVIRFAIQDATIDPGKQTRVPIRVFVDDTLVGDVDVDVDLQTRATLLIPIDGGTITGTTPDARVRVSWTDVNEIDGTVAMRLRWSFKAGDPRQRTISIPFMGALGDSTSCQVAFIDCNPSDTGTICVIERQGRARLDTLCIQDGKERLFDPLSGIDATIIDGALHLTGDLDDVQVMLVDILGRTVGVTCVTGAERSYCAPSIASSGIQWWVVTRNGHVKVIPHLQIK